MLADFELHRPQASEGDLLHAATHIIGISGTAYFRVHYHIPFCLNPVEILRSKEMF